MPRPLNRHQALQNAAFLQALRETGNAREAARRIGAHRATFTKRRAKHPAFAAEWDAALAIADAALHEAKDMAAASATAEPHVLRTAKGRLQLRRPAPRRLTRDGEQAFLAALSATANIRLAAAAAGFSHSAFYARRRASPAFAREMRLALERGYESVELALLASIPPDSYRDDAWRHNDPPATPPMTVDEALMLLRLHQQEVRLQAEPPHIKRRRGESAEAHSFRLSAMYEARLQRDREDYAVAEASRREQGKRSPFEPDAPMLPDLGQVTRRT